MKLKKYQSGSGHLIIIIALIVLLLGALGFVLWQNFMQPKDDDKDNKTTTTSQTTTTQITPEENSEEVVDEFVLSFLSYMMMTDENKSETVFALQSDALTDAFKERISNPEGPVMESPLLLVQDIPAAFNIKNVAEVGNISSSVTVTLFFNSGSEIDIIYSLIVVGNEWKIDSVARA